MGTGSGAECCAPKIVLVTRKQTRYLDTNTCRVQCRVKAGEVGRGMGDIWTSYKGKENYGMCSIRNDITRILCWEKKISPRPCFEGGRSEGRNCGEELIAMPRERKQ